MHFRRALIYFQGLKYCANQRCDSRNPSADEIFHADPFFHVIHLLLSVFSHRESSARAASETYLGFLASPCYTRDRSRCGVRSAPLFSFSLLPPWRCFSLYLSNSTTDYESLFHFPTIHPFAALTYSRPRALCTSIIRAVSLPALAYPRNN